MSRSSPTIPQPEKTLYEPNTAAEKQPSADRCFKISEKADKYIISIGDETTSFPCALYKTDMEKFGVTRGPPQRVGGQNVEITGEVVLNPFGSASEIVLSDPAQLVSSSLPVLTS